MTVDVFVTPDAAIAGLQFDLEYDSSKIQIDGVSEGGLLSQRGDTTFFNGGNIDNNAGTLSAVFGSIIGPSSVSDPESFASITMSVKEQATSTSTIRLKNVIISDTSGNPVDVLTTGLTLNINGVPIAIAGGPSEVNEGEIISFTASGSYDPDGSALTSYEWDFGDGAMASGSEVTHDYADDGTYTITLTVTDNQGATASDTLVVKVNNVAPIVNAGSDQTVDIGDEISFSGSFNDPGSLDTHTISWDFGDGVTTQGTLTPTHMYARSGVYNAILTITDDGGASASDIVTVTVSEPVTNTISIDSMSMSVEENYRFWKWTRIYATAEVMIVDSTGNPVHGATVSGQWSGAINGGDSGITDSNGKVTFNSKSLWASDSKTFTFTVDDVSHTVQWDGETKSDAITYP